MIMCISYNGYVCTFNYFGMVNTMHDKTIMEFFTRGSTIVIRSSTHLSLMGGACFIRELNIRKVSAPHLLRPD